LKALPNLLYTDGEAFSLWRDGEAVGIVRLDGEIASSGSKLSAPSELLPLIEDFLSWQPIPPKNAHQLAMVSARLCRFLRDEVLEQMEPEDSALRDLAKDWRGLLFPKRATSNSPMATRRRLHSVCSWPSRRRSTWTRASMRLLATLPSRAR
jgi:hypothetical protein